MITGITFLAKAHELKRNKEKYSSLSSAKAGGALAADTFLTIVGIIFLVLELILMFYNISIVLKCTKPGAERMVHMVLAIIIPIPYIFGNILFKKCATDILQSNKLF
jgi:hypothetical protein|uniref:Uncharacterized protein n=1 Tax=viral metagenome TaxID=1070528 RepID=A0A6C0J2B5_9ZZZZ